MADNSTPTQSQTAESITLANVHQYLDGDGIFLPEDEDTQGPTPHEIDAAIHNASNSLLHDSSDIDATLNDSHYHQLNEHVRDHEQDQHDDGSLIDPSLMAEHDQLDAQSPQLNDNNGRNVRTGDNTTLHRQAKRRMLSGDVTKNPVLHMAPFVRPQRGDDTPHPEQLVFMNRDIFERWISGESSWCHYVQRRVTNPEKRAEERLKARLRAHERTLAGKLIVLDCVWAKLTLSNVARGGSCCASTQAEKEEQNLDSNGENYLYLSSRRKLCFKTL
jgi:hypothetical protein